MQNPHSTNRRLVISGKYVELYFYEKDIWVGFPRLAKLRHYDHKRPQREIRNDSVSRTRSKIRRLVNANREMVKFMTLTFNTPMLDLTISNPFFNTFTKRISRRYPGWKYLCVPEFQPRSNRVHYHLLCDVPYIPKNELEEIWGQGFVFLRQVDSVDNMGAYICKYLGKANFDKRYFGKKKFFYSSSLRKPLVFSDPLEVDNILKNYDLDFFGDCLKTFTFNTQYLGDIIYYQYRLGIDLSDEIGKKENNEKNTNS